MAAATMLLPMALAAFAGVRGALAWQSLTAAAVAPAWILSVSRQAFGAWVIGACSPILGRRATRRVAIGVLALVVAVVAAVAVVPAADVIIRMIDLPDLGDLQAQGAARLALADVSVLSPELLHVAVGAADEDGRRLAVGVPAVSLTALLATLGNVCSIAFFNYFGVSVTKYMSASSRMNRMICTGLSSLNHAESA
jgi:hypothetical protein